MGIKGDKKSIAERVVSALELGESILPGRSRAELYGDSLLKIEGGGKILLYRPDEIKVRMRKGGRVLSVRGEELCCSSYNRGSLGIEGRISVLEFEREE